MWRVAPAPEAAALREQFRQQVPSGRVLRREHRVDREELSPFEISVGRFVRELGSQGGQACHSLSGVEVGDVVLHRLHLGFRGLLLGLELLKLFLTCASLPVAARAFKYALSSF